jgi:hypothetical protein
MSYECCPQWQLFPSEKTWAWQAMHRLGHSRITFSEPTVSALTRTDLNQSRKLIVDAGDLGWIASIGQAGIYVGCLPPFTRSEE